MITNLYKKYTSQVKTNEFIKFQIMHSECNLVLFVNK
jgi:hypothetical protein